MRHVEWRGRQGNRGDMGAKRIMQLANHDQGCACRYSVYAEHIGERISTNRRVSCAAFVGVTSLQHLLAWKEAQRPSRTAQENRHTN